MVFNFMFIAVSGGIMSLIDGSYEYYHYLHDGIDDNVMFVFVLQDFFLLILTSFLDSLFHIDVFYCQMSTYVK